MTTTPSPPRTTTTATSDYPPPTPPPSAPSLPLSPSTASVRRVHTISSSTSRSRSRILEEGPGWKEGLGEEEEYMAYEGLAPDEEHWEEGGGVGWEGLQRHNSMPSRYSRAFASRHNQPPAVPQLRMRNSLSEIQGEEQGEEEEWEREMRGLRTEGEDPSTAASLSPTDPLITPTSTHSTSARTPTSASSHHSHSRSQSQSSTSSPLSPFLPSLYPGVAALYPPGSGEDLSSDMRRHQSLTYGQRRVSDRLARSPALRQPPGTHTRSTSGGAPVPGSNRSSPPHDSVADEQDERVTPPTSPARASPWGTPPPQQQQGQQGPDHPNQSWEARLEQVQRTIAQFALDGAAHMTPVPAKPGQQQGGGGYTAPRFQPALPPSSAPTSPPHQQQQMHRPPLHLQTTPLLPAHPQHKGPTSAAASFPALGHGAHTNPYLPAHYTPTPLGPSIALQPPPGAYMGMNMNMMAGGGMAMPPPPPLPAGYSGKHLVPRSPNVQAKDPGMGTPTPTQGNFERIAGSNAPPSAAVGSPVDIPALVAAKGYNPANFNTSPDFARYFVIKSYTEDDVHKSLKYEIWSSTEPGNKRLDRAFKESAGRGPIYLFFSVNASGHFCGMAEMLTPVDYTRSSTVWAQDKWKGVFKVRWIFVRDVPNAALRHIKLNNTQERKPVTNSRDTQELLPDAGHEMLRILVNHPARTSLLQDFAYYEVGARAPGSVPPAAADAHPLAQLQGEKGEERGREREHQPFDQPRGGYEQRRGPQQPFDQVPPFLLQGQRSPPQQQQQYQPQQQSPQPPFQHVHPAALRPQQARAPAPWPSTRGPPPPPQQTREQQDAYEQTLQGILRRHEEQPQGPGQGPPQLPPGATVTQFVPGPMVNSGSVRGGF